jgi:hypothetical protein
MATAAYLTGRRRYQRPQALLWAENPGTLQGGVYVPTGFEIGADAPEGADEALLDQFLILSDHNRGELQFKPTRIEQRQRTVNGRMRSYHIADKLSMSLSWSMLPSRGFYLPSDFNANTGVSPYKNVAGQEYTADGGAGGVEILDWYENHKGSFWMYLAYDKYNNFGKDAAAYTHLAQYNQIMEVYFADFNYTVVKRGGANHDLWNISVTLEEV